jgi:hypothetical protein
VINWEELFTGMWVLGNSFKKKKRRDRERKSSPTWWEGGL